jgi:hypothetical protein
VLAVLVQKLKTTNRLSVQFFAIKKGHYTYPRRSQTSTAGSNDGNFHSVSKGEGGGSEREGGVWRKIAPILSRLKYPRPIEGGCSEKDYINEPDPECLGTG